MFHVKHPPSPNRPRAVLFHPGEDDGEGGRGHAFDAAGLAEGQRPGFDELLAGLVRQPLDLAIGKIGRQP